MGKRIVAVLVLLLCLPTLCHADYDSHWARDTISRAIETGIATGDPDGSFAPDRAISRAEFVAFLVNARGLSAPLDASHFTDVDETSWYYPYINAAAYYNLISGYEDQTFRPTAQLSRQDAVTLLCRAYKTPLFGNKSILSNYIDFLNIGDYAADYMAYAVSEELLFGYPDRTLRPEQSLTRAEALVFLDRFDNHFATAEADVPVILSGYPKPVPDGVQNRISLTVRTNMPCNIYYKILETAADTSFYAPAKEQLSTLLVPVTVANTDFTCTITAEPNKLYNIYMVAVANGTYGKITTIKNIAPMPFTQGKGTQAAPYIISNQLQLDQIRNFPDKHFRLDSDIDLVGTWAPIGSYDEQVLMFTGSLDGAGHRITNLDIPGDQSYVGLFSYLFGGTVKNLSVEGSVSGRNDVGIIAGHCEGGAIENCVASGLVASSNNNAGGIVGSNLGRIENCISTVYVVEAVAYAGGIAGRNLGDIQASLSACHSVVSDLYAGSIAGANIGGNIRSSVSANMNTLDVLTVGSGRITTNKQGANTRNNFVYDRMTSSSTDTQPGPDSQDGTDVSWQTLTDEAFYKEVLNWNFSSTWRMPTYTKDQFLLPVLRNMPTPELVPGLTIFAPLGIASATDLLEINEHPDFHYILTGNITLPHTGLSTPNLPTLCPLTEQPEVGFTGSLDGNGYAISNLYIPLAEDGSAEGLFGNIAGGTVRNLHLKNVDITGSVNIGALASVNYGNIENCTVSGKIAAFQFDVAASAGGICGINYGTLDNVESNVDFTVFTNSATIGGVVAQNEGIINNAAYIGTISSDSKGSSSNAVIGGICGINTNGILYNAYANARIQTIVHANYIGGICGILDSGEIYKCSAKGRIHTESQSNTADSIAYVGGICGLSNSGLIMHSFSAPELTSTSNLCYMGGISGYNGDCTIQSTYTTGTLLQTGGVYDKNPNQVFAGGICGLNESGFINSSVALCPFVRSNGVSGKICASTPEGHSSDNYAFAGMDMGTVDPTATPDNGIALSAATLLASDFYTKPIDAGGSLGWSSVRLDADYGVWSDHGGIVPGYTLPVLADVKYQNTFTMPNIKD